jgi:hypothetical protein
LQPGPGDPRIAYVTARLLEEYHYRQTPLDSELSAKFFDGYIDSLDPRHEIFLQTDLANSPRSAPTSTRSRSAAGPWRI